jgi:hypothetical protein
VPAASARWWRNALTECDQVASPTVSITASTRSGQPSANGNAWSAANSSSRARLSSLRLVTHR